MAVILVSTYVKSNPANPYTRPAKQKKSIAYTNPTCKTNQSLIQEVVLESSLPPFAFMYYTKKMDFMQSEFTIHWRKSFKCYNFGDG